MQNTKAYCAITLIDGIIGGLSRRGPRKDRTYCTFSKDVASRLNLDEISTCLGWQRSSANKYFPIGNVNFDVGTLVVPHALKTARGYLEVLYDYDSKIIRFPLLVQLSAFKRMCVWSLDDFVQNAKYAIAYPMAKYLHQVLPLRPASFDCHPFLFTGSIKRFLKNRLVNHCPKNDSFFLSILQGIKRGAEAVPKSFVYKAMLKHKAALTKRPGFNWYMATKFEPYFKRFYSSFKEPKPELFEASTSASADASRSEGGAREYLRDEYAGRTEESYGPRGSVSREDAKSLYDALAGQDLLQMFEERPGLVRELRGKEFWSSYRDLLSELEIRRPDSNIRPEALDKLFKSFERIDPTLNEDVVIPDLLHRDVAVSAVCEPYKVRLVTGGETFKYYLSQFYQKGLWKHLQKLPQFALTGRPVRHEDFYDLVSRCDKLGLTDFEDWVSGDFSAATDNLKIFYTKMAFECSLDKCSHYTEYHREMLRAVLYEQRLIYPLMKEDVNDQLLTDVLQTTGQLMGSVLSFPILCAVNFVCYWMALEIYLKRPVNIIELPVLVNGDDILFRANKSFYSIWQEVISEVGFELSMGKNYIHKTFFTINSSGFNWKSGEVSDVPYFNIGLLTGQSKLGSHGSHSPKALAPIFDYYNPVLAGAQNKLRAHRRFIHYHRSTIDELTSKGQYSPFISPVIGGLGFKLYPELKSEVYFTPFQRRFGYYLKSLALFPYEGVYEKFKPFRGLIVDIKSKQLVRNEFHYVKIETRPRTGPLNKYEEKIIDSESIAVGVELALAYNYGDRPLITVRRPDRKILTGFRQSCAVCARPSSLLVFPFVWVKIKNILPDDSDNEGLPPLISGASSVFEED